MDYEKKYKEALDWMQSVYQTMTGADKEDAEHYFPELKESEDEKIRKALINFLHEGNPFKNIKKETRQRWIAWLEKQGAKVSSIEGFESEFERQVSHLIASTINKEHEYNQGYVKWTANALLNYAKHELEKQGEQKPTDKVESKFKVGDWLQYRDAEPFLVKGITPKGYVNGNALLPFEWENEAHIWTIQDAKDGDVLINEFHLIFIFKEIKNNMYVSHCSVIDRENDTILNSIAEREVGNVNLVKCLPASKKQRDKLEEVIQREGYEWDTEKKELKKIEQKPTNNQFTPEQASVLDKHIDKFLEQNHTWSEEDDDDAWLNDIISKAECKLQLNKGEIDFLKNLKDRVQPHPQSDERNRLLGKLEEWLDEYVSDLADVDAATLICSFTNYLDGKLPKSIKDRILPQPKQEWSEEEKARMDRIIDVLDWAEEKGRISYSDWEDYVCYVKCCRPQSNTKWYKVDDRIQKEIINFFECQKKDEPTRKDTINKWINWIKDRVQPRREWSEDDEYHKRQILRILKDNGCSQTLQEKTEKWIEERLKSPIPQSQWKPSDEQMKGIECAIKTLQHQLNVGDKRLNSLYDALKKLREE